MATVREDALLLRAAFRVRRLIVERRAANGASTVAAVIARAAARAALIQWILDNNINDLDADN